MDIFDIKQGKIKYDNFNIDFTMPLNEQEDDLLEDLLQIEFPNNYLLDVGWYPENDIEGQFVLTLIKNFDWQNPIYKYSCTSGVDLKKAYEVALDIINGIK